MLKWDSNGVVDDDTKGDKILNGVIDYDGQWLDAQVRTSNGLVDDVTKGIKY